MGNDDADYEMKMSRSPSDAGFQQSPRYDNFKSVSENIFQMSIENESIEFLILL